MNGLSDDHIAIDTNVFMHLFNFNDDGSRSAINDDKHIDDILWHLLADSVELIHDSKGKISGEYASKLTPIVQKESESERRQLLMYWIEFAGRVTVDLDQTDQLYNAIQSVVIEPGEGIDRAFIYVAFWAGRILITNDVKHIVFGASYDSPKPTKQTNRTTRLRKATRKFRPKDREDLMDSRNAHTQLNGAE